MRYLLVDRFTEYERGRRAVGLKNVSRADDMTTDYQPGEALLPASMLLETLAQAAGIILTIALDFAGQAMLAKVTSYRSEADATPGDRIEFEVNLAEVRPEGCQVTGVAKVDQRTIATAAFILAIVPSDLAPADFKDKSARRIRAFYPELFGSGLLG